MALIYLSAWLGALECDIASPMPTPTSHADEPNIKTVFLNTISRVIRAMDRVVS